MNNYLKILSYLKVYEGDEKYHDIQNVLLDLDDGTKRKIYKELSKQELIKLIGGPAPTYSIGKTRRDSYMGREVKWISNKIGDDRPYQGKITFKGAKYLKEELQHLDNNKISIHVGDNSTANMILNSPNSTLRNNSKTQDIVSQIIETIKGDITIDHYSKEKALEVFNDLNTEIFVGEPSSTMLNKAISLGAKISSIGSLVLSLFQQVNK